MGIFDKLLGKKEKKQDWEDRFTERLIVMGDDILELMSRKEWGHIEIIASILILFASFCKNKKKTGIEEFKGHIRNHIKAFEQLQAWPHSSARELRIQELNLKASQLLDIDWDRANNIKLSFIDMFEKKYELGEFMTVLVSLFAFYLSRINEKEEQEKLLDSIKFLHKVRG